MRIKIEMIIHLRMCKELNVFPVAFISILSNNNLSSDDLFFLYFKSNDLLTYFCVS